MHASILIEYFPQQILATLLPLPSFSRRWCYDCKFLITFHADGYELSERRKKLSQLWLFVHEKRRVTKNCLIVSAGRKNLDEDQVENVISNMQQFNLFSSHNDDFSEGETKFLMQFSVRVKFTGKTTISISEYRQWASERRSNKVSKWMKIFRTREKKKVFKSKIQFNF